MAKLKTKYVCSECNAEHIKWAGQCKECKEYNTLVEDVYEELSKNEIKNRTSKRNAKGYSSLSGKLSKLSSVDVNNYESIKTDNKSLDLVLSSDGNEGGGIVKGGVVLIGGDPGIGKSTLLLQLSSFVSQLDNEKVIYISGEEAESQIASRAKRLELNTNELYIYNKSELEDVLSVIAKEKPTFIVVDSIQTMYSLELASAPGGVSQITECATAISQIAKDNNISTFIIGHITKGGELAGPKTLEHIVDTILYFEGEPDSSYRTLKVNKNRYGPTNEMAIFEMNENGLKEVSDPSVMFLENDYDEASIGTVVLATQEKNKAFLIEVQSLVDTNDSQYPKRVANGIEYNRLIFILAVINNITNGTKISSFDVFINVLSGVKIVDTSSDLAVFLSLMSSLLSLKMKGKTAVFGEISLNGKLRLTKNFEQRISVAEKSGFEYIVMPVIRDEKVLNKIKSKFKNIKIVMCNNIIEAKNFCFY